MIEFYSLCLDPAFSVVCCSSGVYFFGGGGEVAVLFV